MEEDTKGFLYPQVDSSICIECGLCEKVCPFDEANISLYQPQKAYAAWNKNREEHLTSSSGGAAYVLSSYILSRNGVVYGCAANGMDIRHIRVDKVSDLYRLQGSKYVQSDVRGIFRQVKDDLKANRPVLFIGTPCQVAGLKNYIGRTSEILYLVDLICHGVPSQKMLRDHVSHVAKGTEIRQILFRKGNVFVMSLMGDNFTYSARKTFDNKYLKAFLKGIIYRPSCYQCLFAKNMRCSDITIGDFWGLQDAQKLPPERHNGISVLLPMTDKGISLIQECENSFTIYERSVDEAVKGNTQLRHPMQKTTICQIFNLLYSFVPFDTAVSIVTIGGDIKETAKKIIKKVIYAFYKRQ